MFSNLRNTTFDLEDLRTVILHCPDVNTGTVSLRKNVDVSGVFYMFFFILSFFLLCARLLHRERFFHASYDISVSFRSGFPFAYWSRELAVVNYGRAGCLTRIRRLGRLWFYTWGETANLSLLFALFLTLDLVKSLSSFSHQYETRKWYSN